MGVLGNFKDAVNLVNRTNRKLNVRYDGEDIVLQPGENPGFPKIAVQYAKNQNPLMGSKHPIDPRKFVCLVGVKAPKGEKQRDAIEPISEDTLATADGALEVIDRAGKFWGEPQREVKLLKKTGYTNYEAQVAIGADFSSGANVGEQ